MSVDWNPPEEFDDYLLVQPLGRGEMGHVYLAYDTVLARHVAVKFIATLQPDTSARQRFLIEARAAARVQHPNVATIYRVGELGEQPYIISEFVRGQSLDEVPKPVPWRRALEIGVALARGLAAAHRKGVLHCDLKPANAILAEDGTAKLFDFGLATLLEVPRGDGGGSEDGPMAALPSARAGTVVGTPDYMAPEVWRAEPASRRSDVYSLGVLLYELSSGRVPHEDVEVHELPRVVQVRDARPLAQVAPMVDRRFAAIVERCIRRDPRERFASGDELREALEQLERTASGAVIPEGNPYRGLRPFESEHRALFFGRSAEIGVVLDRLRSEPFVLVMGDSGVGKSSICRAGVLPLVADGALEGGRTWEVLTFVPGKQPLRTLCEALAERLGGTEAELAARLREDPDVLGQELRKHLGDTKGLVIFVDQLEELTTVSEPDEAEVVERLIARLAAGVGGVRLLGTLRADFLTRVASLPSLGEEISRALYILRPLTADRIREVIEGPAGATGFTFESAALVGELVESTAHAQGGLPLLQFALAELWEARDQATGTITAAALDSLGGVAGALARHADAVLARMLPSQRVAARRMLKRFVTLEGTRARRTEQELTGDDPSARAALDALVRGRLVVAYDADEGSAYELAHEVLLTGWTTLRQWLQEDAEGRIVRERIAAAAAEWERLHRSADALWSARQLQETVRLQGSELQAVEREFLLCSQRAVRRARWIRRGLIAAAPVLAATVYAVVEYRAYQDLTAKVGAQVASARRALGEARSKRDEAEALRKSAFVYFEARHRVEGDRAWQRALALAAEAARSYATASQSLEAALAMDPRRPDVRGLFGDVLLERALLAEHDRRIAQRDELVQRLALYDEDGERMRRWNAPAHLEVTSTPPGAAVALFRYVPSERGKLQELPVGALGRTPLAGVEVGQGSHLMTFAMEGRAAVRLPLLLSRGERLHVHVDLPAASEVPPGFVYVPPGRFLFGTTADETLRRGFFDTVPLHERWTSGYLIGVNEVTVADWIEFLRQLPAAERTRRMPNSALLGFTGGSLKLRELPGGTWEYTYRTPQRRYRVRTGERIRYQARARRASQDWTRFPVTAISAGDAEAYLAWLRRSGRLPGARLCTELEWERAARGADGREFPHGGRLDPEDANYDETYGKSPIGMGPDEVGSYPASRSPFGLDDMTGNAFEWATSVLVAGQYVARGGSYFYDEKSNHLSNRQVPVPTLRDSTLGFRVCASFPPSGALSGPLSRPGR